MTWAGSRVTRLVAAPEEVVHGQGRPVRLDRGGDPREHRHGLHRVLAGGRLAREHHAVGAVEDGVGDVGGLGARRPAVLGHRLEHLRGGDDRLALHAREPHQALLDEGDLLDRHLDAEVAAGDHEAVGGGEDLVDVLERARALDLGDDERLVAEVARRGAHRLDVRRALDERLAHRVDARLEREGQALAVARREGADAQLDVGQVEPLARAQLAADPDLADHLGAADLERRSARCSRRSGTACRRASRPAAGGRTTPRRAARRRRCPAVVRVKRSPGCRSIGSSASLPMRIFGPDRSAMMAMRRPTRLRGRAQVLDDLPVAGEVAVREVQPRDVHARLDQLDHDLRRLRRGADGGDDLGLVGRQRHLDPSWLARQTMSRG